MPPSEPNSKISFTGSCACRRITYASHARPFDTQTCMCTTCRKLSGGAGQTFTGVSPPSAVVFSSAQLRDESGLALPAMDDRREVLTADSGPGFVSASASSPCYSSTSSSGLDKHRAETGLTVLRFSSTAERFFCTACSSPLGMRYSSEKDNIIWLAVGSIDEVGLSDEAREHLCPKKEIFTNERAWWIPEGLKLRFEGFDPSGPVAYIESA